MDAGGRALHAARVSGGSIVIVGRGRVGRGLARALEEAGAAPRLVAGRGRAPRLARGEVAILATPDPALSEVEARLAAHVERGAVVLHCSGMMAPGALAACRAAGASVGAMHPLASFADPGRPPRLAGTSFVVAGDRRAVSAARRVAKLVGARVVARSVHGPAYHAAAALSANGAAALAAVAVRVLRAVGLERREAERAIGALLRTVGENVERVGVPRALSGPVIRGDAEAVRVHREALGAVDGEAREAYDAVAPAILACATAAGLDEERASAVRRALARERGAE